MRRRSFLRLAAWSGFLVAAGGGALALAGRRNPAGSATAPAVPITTPELPAAASPLPAPPVDPSQVARGLSPWTTPADDFFRIDIAMSLPEIEASTWALVIDGGVGTPLKLSYDDLCAFEVVEVDATLSCVSNPVGGYEIGNARWTGVRLADVLATADVDADVEQVFTYGTDGFTAGFPIAAALQRDAIIALGMNGQTLRPEHGHPARLVVPGLYGYVSATKWLQRIELTTWAAQQGYWIPRGWSRLGPAKTGSRIEIPKQGADVMAGEVDVAGMSWCGTGAPVRVEVQVDDGQWRTATLGAVVSALSWRQWWLSVPLTPGRHRLTVRAYDADGVMQTEQVSDVAPDGATGWHYSYVDVA